MRLPLLPLCSSQPMLALLSLALTVPGAYTHPHFPLAILPTLEIPDWEAALQLQASLDVPVAVPAGGFPPWGSLLELGPGDPRLQLLRELVAEDGWGQQGIRRGQRGDLERTPLGPFPGHPMETLHYGEGGEGGGKRNEALTSIAGGLQAFNREKGGFGFRFGRKR